MHFDGSPSPFEHLLPDSRLDVEEYYMDLFFKTMIERQEIYHKKEILKQPYPWTEDKIFREFKFTNVYRELDKNSRWEIENIVINNDLTDEDRLFQILVFRAFNNPLFFEFIKERAGDIWEKGIPKYSDYHAKLFSMCIDKYRKQGKNPFTNSYVTNSKYCPGQSRDWCFGNRVIPEYHQQTPQLLKFIINSKTALECAQKLRELPSAGGFLAHEYYISLCYIGKYREESFFRWTEDDWTNVGPGASLGIRLIFPSLDTIKKQEQAIYWLRDISSSKLEELGGFRYPYYYEKLTLHQIEFFLCEFGKYWRMLVGEGKTRQKYKHSL